MLRPCLFIVDSGKIRGNEMTFCTEYWKTSSRYIYSCPCNKIQPTDGFQEFQNLIYVKNRVCILSKNISCLQLLQINASEQLMDSMTVCNTVLHFILR